MPRQPLYKKVRKESPKYARLAGAGLFLLIWTLLALAVRNEILLPDPWSVLVSVFSLLGQDTFRLSLMSSLRDIVLAFILALLFALTAGFWAFFRPYADLLFSPFLSLCRSAPLGALTIILLIWINASALPFVLIFLAITPPLYSAVKAGLAAAPDKLLEMAFVFRLKKRDTLRHIYLPSLRRQLAPTLEFTAGLAWKAGVTGEILALPRLHLGTALYDAKIQLDSAQVIALLAFVVGLSWLMAKGLSLLLRLMDEKTLSRQAEAAEAAEAGPELPPPAGEELSGSFAEGAGAAEPGIILTDVTKVYKDKMVLDGLCAVIPAGQKTVVTGPSGRGKSTLFRLLMGIEQPDGGAITYGAAVTDREVVRYGASFQEGRLLERLSGLDNLLLVSGANSPAEKEAFCRKWEARMAELGLPAERPARFYSGGMKQKLSLLRALAAPSDILILDEVFREVDPASEAKMLSILDEERNGRTLLMATHHPDLARKVCTHVVRL